METHYRGEENEKPQKTTIFYIRQALNIIFMIGAVIGCILYWYQPEPTLGILVVMTSMFFKMAECVLRFKK